MFCSIVRPRWKNRLRWMTALMLLSFAGFASASEYHGQVLFNDLPVPGATVIATQGSKVFTAITDEQGAYSFADLPDGAWKIHIEMQAFSPIDDQVTIAPSQPAGKWELKMLSLSQIMAESTAVKVEEKPPVIVAAPTATKAPAKNKAASGTPEAPKPPEEAPQQSNEGLLINGSVNNAATSQYSLAQAFGNQRSGGKGLYTGGVSLMIDNSAFDATPYSITGVKTPKTPYSQVTAGFQIGGPIRIPHVLPRGPNFFVAYQWMRNRADNTADGLVPTEASRVPMTPQSTDLLAFYPLPNVAGSPSYNYQVPIVSNTHQDSLQSRLDKGIGRKDNFYGGFAFQSTRSDTPNLFGFVDTTDVLGLRTNVNWIHRFSSRLFLNLGYQFSRQRTDTKPNFSYRTDVENNAGIEGYDHDPSQWGPPSLSFSSGIYPLSDGNSAFNRNRTDLVSPAVTWYKRKHNFTFGGDFRRQEFNYYAQSNPRGSFTFTSATNGLSDFQKFLNGTPDAATVSYGNPDKYLRQSVYDLYAADDWRLLPQLTLNIGARWEYGAPITELKGRMTNLVVAPDFSSYSLVTGVNSQGLPTSLIRPDKSDIEPRIALSWRPIPGSTLVIRSGYGVYADTSVYQATALAMAEQSPCPQGAGQCALAAQFPSQWTNGVSYNNAVGTSCSSLSLATGLNAPCGSSVQDTFAVDPNFRVGYVQTWQLSAQRDLPFALQMTATYLGMKGTHGVQEFLPNSYAIGGAPVCASCPLGFLYRTSGGDSTRESGSFQLRRRLRSGFTASALYTYSKSLDDDAVLGGQGPLSAGATSQSTAAASIAQNWLNLRGERGRSTFDQRNLLNATIQYTSGMGKGGGTLLSGWRGRVFKDWTVLGTLVVGSGLPETPIYPALVPGTTYSNVIRPTLTGASIYAAPAGLHLNPAAYTAPAAGQWGNAGRDSITGPSQFTFNADLMRTFRLDKRLTLDVRMEATNVLNHVTFSTWNTAIGSPTFGAPAAANGPRMMQLTSRLRF